VRQDQRAPNQLRPVSVQLDYLDHPAGSCLVSLGRTRVLCAVSIDNKVPPFLAGRGQGWLTAEYSLLPASTRDRTQREANAGRLTGRTQEIRRFIGRSLRPVFDLSLVGERTFIIDCDVIQADGGTRTAAVTGAYIALHRALRRMMDNGAFRTFPLLDFVAAASAGVVDGQPVLDLDYEEDRRAEVDLNLVMSGRGRVIEVGATAERVPLERPGLDRLIDLAAAGIKELIALEKNLLGTGRTGV
jgi:ribonuclease PH